MTRSQILLSLLACALFGTSFGLSFARLTSDPGATDTEGPIKYCPQGQHVCAGPRGEWACCKVKKPKPPPKPWPKPAAFPAEE